MLSSTLICGIYAKYYLHNTAKFIHNYEPGLEDCLLISCPIKHSGTLQPSSLVSSSTRQLKIKQYWDCLSYTGFLILMTGGCWFCHRSCWNGYPTTENHLFQKNYWEPYVINHEHLLKKNHVQLTEEHYSSHLPFCYKPRPLQGGELTMDLPIPISCCHFCLEMHQIGNCKYG